MPSAVLSSFLQHVNEITFIPSTPRFPGMYLLFIYIFFSHIHFALFSFSSSLFFCLFFLLLITSSFYSWILFFLTSFSSHPKVLDDFYQVNGSDLPSLQPVKQTSNTHFAAGILGTWCERWEGKDRTGWDEAMLRGEGGQGTIRGHGE